MAVSKTEIFMEAYQKALAGVYVGHYITMREAMVKSILYYVYEHMSLQGSVQEFAEWKLRAAAALTEDLSTWLDSCCAVADDSALNYCDVQWQYLKELKGIAKVYEILRQAVKEDELPPVKIQGCELRCDVRYSEQAYLITGVVKAVAECTGYKLSTLVIDKRVVVKEQGC